VSGGSYNYLCYQLDARGHLDIGDLKSMRDRLAQLAPDAAATRATAELYEMLNRVVNDEDTTHGGLTDVWRAVEWCDSGDSTEDRVREALAEYEAKVRKPAAGRRGWFADYDDDQDSDWHGKWRPYLQLDGMCFPLADIGFYSEADCDQFIRDDILGKGLLSPSP
jgi:hypothetical protein